MPSYDLTGTVKCVMDPQTFSSGFTKREFVVTTEGERFPQDIKFECVKERVALLDSVQPGQRVSVTFDLRGNEYNERYFVNLAAWKVQPAEAGAGAAAGADDGAHMPPMSVREEPAMDGDDEIMPF
jgi:single-strand DNA-binding protein